MAGNVWRPENASHNLASTDRSMYPDSRTPEEFRRSQCDTCAESNSQDNANVQGDTNPLPLALDNNPEIKREESEEEDTNPLTLALGNNPEVKREESEEEGVFCKAGCEEECDKPRQECKACKYEQGWEEGSEKDSGQESKQKTEQDTGEYAQGSEESCEDASEQVAGKYAQGYGEDYDEDYEEASEEEFGEYAQGSDEYYEEASEEDGEAANVTSSHKQLKHKAPSGHGKMGNSVDMENQKHATLRCSHCRGPHRKLNCPELPCSHCKVQGHVSLLCAERLAKIRKSRITEMRNLRKREAKGPAPVASGDSSQQSGGANAGNPQKRKSRGPPSTPTGTYHESASNDNGDPSSPEANQDSDDNGPQDSSASTKKTQEQELTARPMRCDNCKGPHRKRVCPHLPCAYCKEEGHTSGACPERLLKQQKTRTANMRMWRKSEASKKGKTGGDDSKGVGDGSSDHDNPNTPRLRCSVCRGPHRKPACPELPCAYCGERGHVRHDCPKRLADRKERVASRKRQKKSKQY